MSDIKEFSLNPREFFPKSMSFVIESLKNNKKIKLVGNSNNSNQIARVAETLKREGYIEYDDIKTQTQIDDNSRQVKLAITMHVTSNFDELSKKYEEETKKKLEERKKRENKKE